MKTNLALSLSGDLGQTMVEMKVMNEVVTSTPVVIHLSRHIDFLRIFDTIISLVFDGRGFRITHVSLATVVVVPFLKCHVVPNHR